MEVQIFLPKNAKIEIIEREYPDIYEDGDNRCLPGNHPVYMTTPPMPDCTLNDLDF